MTDVYIVLVYLVIRICIKKKQSKSDNKNMPPMQEEDKGQHEIIILNIIFENQREYQNKILILCKR